MEGVIIPEFLVNVRTWGWVRIKCGLKNIRNFHEKTTGQDDPSVKGNCFYTRR